MQSIALESKRNDPGFQNESILHGNLSENRRGNVVERKRFKEIKNASSITTEKKFKTDNGRHKLFPAIGV
jgi:hypothetical protein